MKTLISNRLAISTLMMGTVLAFGLSTVSPAQADCSYANQTFSCEAGEPTPEAPDVSDTPTTDISIGSEETR